MKNASTNLQNVYQGFLSDIIHKRVKGRATFEGMDITVFVVSIIMHINIFIY